MRIVLLLVVGLCAATAATSGVSWLRLHQHQRPSASLPAPQPELYRRQYAAYGQLAAPGLRELSGIVASRIHPGVYWVHNDSGNPPELFAIDEFGRDLGVWRISGAKNDDWEDITTDDHGHLIIADSGDNHQRRSDQRLYVVDEPRDLRRQNPLPVRQIRPFLFPNKHRNCEAVFDWRGQQYLIEKIGKLLEPTRNTTVLYRLPNNGASTDPATLEPIEEFDFHGPVTAADLSPDGRHLAVLTYTVAYVFDRADPSGRFFTPQPHSVLIACGQVEAVAFHHDGSGDLLLASEQRMIYRLPRAWYTAGTPYVPGARLTPASQPRQP